MWISCVAVVLCLLFPQDDAAARAKRILGDADYQTHFPPAVVRPSGTPPPAMPELKLPRRAEDLPYDSPAGAAMRGVVLVVGGILVLVLLGVIARALFGARMRRGPERAAPGGAEPRAGAPRPVDTSRIDALVRAGNWEGAVHEVLFQAIGHLESRGLRFPERLTSREILGEKSLGADVRKHLAAIIAVVERSHFARRPIDREAYAGAAEELQRLREASSGSFAA